MSELKPCPFCGSPAYLWLRRNEDDTYTTIIAQCDNDDCGAEIAGFRNIDDAIKVWNRGNLNEMTNEEAITTINLFPYWGRLTDKEIKAFSMAIEALYKEEGNIKGVKYERMENR